MKTLNGKSMMNKVVEVERGCHAESNGSDWSLAAHLGAIGRGSASLVKGMGLTLGYLVNPSKVITQQYPENRETLEMFPRFRGHVVMVEDEEGQPLCTACGICEKACPNGTISVLSCKGPGGKGKVLGRYVYRLSQCTLCNLCVESCPFEAIRMARDFELAVYDRVDLDLVLFDSQEAP